MVSMYSPLQGGGFPQNPWASALGIDAFLNPSELRLRSDELRQLSQQVNTNLQGKNAQGLLALMQLLRGMPHEDLLTLLALLRPDLMQMLSDSMGRTAFNENGAGMPSMPNMNNGGGPAPSGGGRSSGGAPSSGGPSAASGPAPSGPAPGGTASGQKLAQAAEQVARTTNTTGWCYRGVSQAVSRALGVQLTGASAYMAADQIAASGKFKEVKVSPEELKKLPPGAVVVWGKTGASPHGHISVALGDGREASDHIQQQMTSLRGSTNYRVFIPN